MENKKPSLSEVKEYFKNAVKVKCLEDRKKFNITKNINKDVHEFQGNYWIDLNDISVLLWQNEKGYAKILTYKNTEPKFEITKEQILELSKDAYPSVLGQLKEWFPEVFETVLEVGKWYYQNTYGKSIFKITNIEGTTVYGYGFNYKGIYKEDSEWFDINNNKGGNIRFATTEELTEVLKNEAVKRGFKNNIYFSDTNNEVYLIDGDKIEFDLKTNKLYINGWEIFRDGIWAEVLDTKTIKEAEELLKELGHNFKIV